MTESSDQVRGGVVAVLGCGNMGAAFVRSLLASGRRVVVWNRTTERTGPLASAGAEVRATAREAAREAALVIVCLGTTEDVRAVLEAIGPQDLRGRVLLNVTTGSPEDAHQLGDWATSGQLDYLDAAIGAYPEQIGTADARILVAGDERLWEAVRDTVSSLAGASTHVGPELGAANVIDAAMTGAFYITSLVAFVEAARFMQDMGVSTEVMADQVGYSVGVLQHQLIQIVERISTGAFAADEASLNVYADASDAFARGMSAVGDASMISATARVLREAVSAGLGDEDIAALVKVGLARR